jgi:hypothetical protein
MKKVQECLFILLRVLFYFLAEVGSEGTLLPETDWEERLGLPLFRVIVGI